MDNEEMGMILPEIKMGKATIRKVMIDENGMTYEVEEEIEVPIFDDSADTNKEEE